jgi:hypothetical protein
MDRMGTAPIRRDGEHGWSRCENCTRIRASARPRRRREGAFTNGDTPSRLRGMIPDFRSFSQIPARSKGRTTPPNEAPRWGCFSCHVNPGLNALGCKLRPWGLNRRRVAWDHRPAQTPTAPPDGEVQRKVGFQSFQLGAKRTSISSLLDGLVQDVKLRVHAPPSSPGLSQAARGFEPPNGVAFPQAGG